MYENEYAPVDPVGHDVNLTRHGGPVGPHSMTEQSALLGLMTDGTKNAAVCPGGPDGNSAGRGEPGDRSGPVGSRSGTDRPVLKDRGRNAPNCPVGCDVMLAGRREMVDRPDPVGPHSRTEQSVFLRLDADQGEHIPTNRVHPGVKMFRTQPVAGVHR